MAPSKLTFNFHAKGLPPRHLPTGLRHYDISHPRLLPSQAGLLVMLITTLTTAGALPVLHGQDTVISLYEATTDRPVQPGSAPLRLLSATATAVAPQASAEGSSSSSLCAHCGLSQARGLLVTSSTLNMHSLVSCSANISQLGTRNTSVSPPI